MEEQASSVPSFSVAPVWLKVLLGAIAVSVGILEVSNHGLRSWDWTWSVLFLGIIFSDTVRGPLDKNVRWPWRILSFLWIIGASAWFVHFVGWMPALAFAGMALVSQKQQKWLGWKTSMAKPERVIFALSGLTFVMWFAWKTGGWVPTFCVVAAFCLLETDMNTRRTLVENLKRRSFLAVVCLAAVAAIWASLHPSFGSIAASVAVIVLACSDVYLHTEDRYLAHS